MNGDSPTSTPNRSRPEWFAALLADTAIRNPSAHTMKAYRQDFDASAVLVAGGGEDLSSLSLVDLTTEDVRSAFVQNADPREAAAIQRCWPKLERSHIHRDPIGSEISLRWCHLTPNARTAPLREKLGRPSNCAVS
jgi:hypothetical protein